MIHSRSFTSATPSSSPRLAGNAPRQLTARKEYAWRAACVAIILLGGGLRLLRLAWQPLWWDEGYSIYFATEPLTRMLWLTAQDIHPPLYYALLHLWFALLGSTGPETARLFSVLIGTATLPLVTWASLILLPARRWLALLPTLLLAVNPWHLFYSQEVRMYALALLLSLLATILLCRISTELIAGNRPVGLTTSYIIAASLALLTLYYVGFLLLAHQLWALTTHRNQRQHIVWFLASTLLILLLQLPWWLYALPKLVGYVADKVIADQDVALPLWSYLWRHWVAIWSGHLPAAHLWIDFARHAIAAPLLLASGLLYTRTATRNRAQSWLLTLILLPLLVGFVINLRLPFFPDGGERLLLYVLPYALLLLTVLLDKLASIQPRLALACIALPLGGALIGTFTFFTLPRYVEHDYRPVIADVMTHARPEDSILALFPWQVGYWRAYSPRDESGTLLLPQPAPVDQSVLRWDAELASQLDEMLAQGTIWFPMPLSFGSTLPGEIEAYLLPRARNLANQWYSPATLLTGWTRLDSPSQPQTIGTTFAEAVTLTGGGISPTTLPSDNSPLAIDLCWHSPDPRPDLRATLRLQDERGYTWAKRDLTPLAAFVTTSGDARCEALAMTIPVGLPPGTYHVALGVGPEQSDTLFSLPTGASLITLGNLTIVPPNSALSPYRLPVDNRSAAPPEAAGVRLLGKSGAAAPILAGDEVALTLFLQSTANQPPDRELYVDLLNQQGERVTGWQDWPLPSYPPSTWTPGTLAQAPLSFYLPADLAADDYTLIAGFVDPAISVKSASAELGKVSIVRRPAIFTEPVVAHQVTPIPELGTHAQLIGYDVVRDGDTLQLALTWRVLRPLLPPHHIFVHLFDATGQRIAQSDGEPMTDTGRAPTGSWLPGEYLTTHHTLTTTSTPALPLNIHTGLYLPSTGARLPVTIEGEGAGDSVRLEIAP